MGTTATSNSLSREGVMGLFDEPAIWGAAGAFAYGGLKWTACLAARNGEPWWLCTLEFVVILITGAIAAAAFSAAFEAITKFHDTNAVSAIIGLLANPTAPVLVKRLSGLAGNLLASKIEDKLPPEGGK